MAHHPRDPLTEALALLSELAQRGEPLSVSVQRGGVTATLVIRAKPEDASGHEPEEHGAAPDGSHDGDTELDEAILGVLEHAEKPLKRVGIARRANRANNSYFASRLQRLCLQGRVKTVNQDFYWLASRTPIPSPG